MLGMYWFGVGCGIAVGVALGGIVTVATVLYFTRKPVDAELLQWGGTE